jgi:hypothetical protein
LGDFKTAVIIIIGQQFFLDAVFIKNLEIRLSVAVFILLYSCQPIIRIKLPYIDFAVNPTSPNFGF